MISIKSLNAICYAVCLICIIAGVVFAMLLIWGEIGEAIAWKGFSTIGVLLLAAALTMAINKMMDDRGAGRHD